jgi:hypothetical protein
MASVNNRVIHVIGEPNTFDREQAPADFFRTCSVTSTGSGIDVKREEKTEALV